LNIYKENINGIKSSLGICIGASTISFVKLVKDSSVPKLDFVKSITHDGNPKQVLKNFFKDNDSDGISIVVTGRKFKNLVNTYSISEPEAIELSYQHMNYKEKFGVIVSLGGENFIVYCLNKSGNISNVITGNKCASGTGEFFLQQIGRMNLNVEEAISLSENESPYIVSGRCSVFCKSDCTHALNKGVPKPSVVSGLAKMIADKSIELLSKQKSKDILIVGGVSRNNSVINYIREHYPCAFIPEEAVYFEAYGAALKALKVESYIDKNDIFGKLTISFNHLEPLLNGNAKVTFKEITKSVANPGDVCYLGLDVGSTTTKAVIIRDSDNAMLASVYLRTNGNPVNASIECYKSLAEQINVPVNIIGLGTTGSGRQISALHALTNGIVNEIIAHAVAAAFFDEDVDTIFEIGGQDAKYTYLTNSVASDYAMNEACSAGTGSFLEESAKETLNIYYKDIADIAFKAQKPLNFNDQCAAFISSDIKNSSHDGESKEDIVAGLVYSICMNYVNRVKGNRQVGKKVFMQGGVCYNKAVPFAMSHLINKEIIVPPEPGLMGAFGVALEIKNRINLGFNEKGNFNLLELINREFHYSKEFTCSGGKEKCDLKCSISMIEIEGKKYPFGGACSKYYNLRQNISEDNAGENYVKLRQELVYKKYADLPLANGKSIGVSKSFLTNTLYPLYYNFFTKLGFKVVLSNEVDQNGVDKIRSAYCYPVEIAHGLFQNLVNKKVDYIFLPHITQMQNQFDEKYKRICVFVQGESYYLKSAFSDDKIPELISPVIDFTAPERYLEKTFVSIAKKLDKSSSAAFGAFDYAYGRYKAMLEEFKKIGENIIAGLEKDKEKIALVLFGRSYNSYAIEANLNIPHKISSKNIMIIPHDFLPDNVKDSYDNMYWHSGQQILSAARFVKNHKKLFGVYITNFSCGPDSFIVSYFRKIMGTKPSLTLELDSHSADVGVDTRIDAALDIIRNYIELTNKNLLVERIKEDKSLSVITENNRVIIVDSENQKHKVTSPDIEVLIPSMGNYSSQAFSGVFRSLGINSSPIPIPTQKTLKYGRGLTTCKECLPFILSTGSLLEQVEKKSDNSKKYLFFMPHGYGPCRQGQYFIMLRDIISDLDIKNVGVLTMNEEGSFEDFGSEFFRRAWIAVVISDAIHDIESAIITLSVDKISALEILHREWNILLKAIEAGNEKLLFLQLEKSASVLSGIKLTKPLSEAKVISLIGEIYVRREEFSRGDLIESLRSKGFLVKTAPISEYVYYSNYMIINRKINGNSFKERIKILIKDKFQRMLEKKIKNILAKTGLIHPDLVDIEKTIEYGNNMISDELIGEGILTAGLAMREILDDSCGVISIGPFNCMPSRLSESILNKEMTLEGKYKFGNIKRNGYPPELTNLPFLYVETDGNAFPQITQSKIEIFMLQADKLHRMMESRHK
jgi:predicted CoA-substrate-specific enzyme activase